MKKHFTFRIAALVFALTLIASFLPAKKQAKADGDLGLESMDWVENLKTRELYNGVTMYDFTSKADSVYKLNHIHIVEFDPRQSDLYVDVTNCAEYSNKLKTVEQTMKDFNETNGQGKTAIAGINGDMWMVTYAHARVLGHPEYLSGSYKSYADDPVVTKSLTIPRGYNVYQGEIISTGHISAETPFEGDFQSFGFSADGEAQVGQPSATVKLGLAGSDETIKIDGINRLPAKNAIIMYTDKGPVSNYALEDAYEIIIDFDFDYVIKHGANITGKVVGICKQGDEDMPMKANRIIITARGKRVSKLEALGIKVGDNVTIDVQVKDGFKNNEFWQNVYTACGGHMVFFKDGKASNLSGESGYPTTIIAKTKSGKVLFIEADGRQSGYSVGIPFDRYDDLGKALDFEDAFVCDGGGSATMVELAKNGYKLTNRPSDKKEDGSYGSPRTVVNSVIVSYGRDRNEPDPTEEPTQEPVQETEVPAENTAAPVNPSSDKSGGISDGAIIGIGAGLIVIIAAVVVIVLKPWKKN